MNYCSETIVDGLAETRAFTRLIIQAAYLSTVPMGPGTERRHALRVGPRDS